MRYRERKVRRREGGGESGCCDRALGEVRHIWCLTHLAPEGKWDGERTELEIAAAAAVAAGEKDLHGRDGYKGKWRVGRQNSRVEDVADAGTGNGGGGGCCERGGLPATSRWHR